MVKIMLYTEQNKKLKTTLLASPGPVTPRNPNSSVRSSRTSANSTDLQVLSTQPSAFMNSPYDPRLYKTVDPTCITTTRTATLVEATQKISIYNHSNMRGFDPNFFTDLDEFEEDGDDFYTTEMVADPQYYQDYLMDSQTYDYDNSNMSFDITSYELDSNPTPRSNNDNDNINSAFFHHTPSPNNQSSIRIITASNRIAKLRDKKLVQAIRRSLDISKEETKCVEFKTLNDNHSTSLKQNNLLFSARKEISNTLTNAILQNDLSERLFKNAFVPLENYVFTSISKQLSNEEVNDTDSLKLTTRDNSQHFLKIFDKTTNAINTKNQLVETSIDINEYEETLKHLESDIDKVKPEKKSNKTEECLTIEPSPNKRKRTKTQNTTELDEPYEDITVRKIGKRAKRGRRPKNIAKLKEKKPSDLPETDIVLKLFRESMRKNKDNFNKLKINDCNQPVPKIAKLKVSRNASNITPESRRPHILEPSKNVKSFESNTAMFEEKDIYKCAECFKVFRQRSQWKRHVDCIHLKIAKFVCIKCNKAFKRSDHLKNHIRRIHAASQ